MSAKIRARRQRAALLASKAVERHDGILPHGSDPSRHARLMACLVDALDRRIKREDALIAAVGHYAALCDKTLAEVARHLSLQNENVRRGDVLAAIRDLAQVKVSALGNCETLERRVLALTAELAALDPKAADRVEALCR